MLKISQFTISVQVDDSNVALYNTLTNAFATIDKDEWEKYRIGKDLDKLPYARDMLKYGFIVPHYVDEFQTFLLQRNKIKFNHKTISFTVLTTYACNLACRYCMQGPELFGLNNGGQMMDTDRIAKFIADIRDEYGSKQIVISYFGGEPLLNMAGIESINASIRALVPSDVEINQMVITNGTLIPRYIQQLKQANINILQVTLDGPQEIHDARRVKKGGQGTFHEAVKGISCALDAGLFVVVHVVVDAHNAPHISNLAKFLRHRFERHMDNLAINIGLMSNPGWDSAHCSLYISDKATTATQFTQAVESVLREGLQVIDFLTPSPCARERDNEFIISPDGQLYKCISGVGRREFHVGYVDDTPLSIAQKSAPFINFGAPMKECRSCPYLPYCNGGCRFNALVDSGNVWAIDCWKDFHAASMPELIRLYAHTTSTTRPYIRRWVGIS